MSGGATLCRGGACSFRASELTWAFLTVGVGGAFGLPFPLGEGRQKGKKMRIALNVPFAEKDQAKRLGCKWNGAEKRWYIEDPENIELFMRWIPEHLKKPHQSIRPAVPGALRRRPTSC